MRESGLSVGVTQAEEGGDRPSICLLGMSLNTENLGVNALANGTVRCILSSTPKASLFLLDYAKEPSCHRLRLGDRDIKLECVNIRFSKKFYLRNNVALLILVALFLRALPLGGLRRRIARKIRVLSRIDEADSAASIAGGDSFSDIYGLGRLFYVTLPQILVLLMGKKLVQLPQTYGPFRARMARLIARQVLSRSEVIYSRDRRGLKGLELLLGLKRCETRVRFCYDVGFTVHPVVPKHPLVTEANTPRDGSRPLVGLNVSGLLYMGGYTRDNMFGLKTDYQELIEGVIRLLIERKSAAVLLIPHVYGTAEHAESDLAACGMIYERLRGRYGDSLRLVRDRFNEGEIKSVIGLCDFFIGSRMHACIAALSQDIPAVAIAYSDKFVGVMESVEMGSLVVDPRKSNLEEILEAVGRAFDERAGWREKLAQTMPRVRETVFNTFADLATMTEPTSSRAFHSRAIRDVATQSESRN